MIITVSGNAGSGKDTAGELLRKKLSFRLIKGTLRVFAREKGIDILDFEKKFTKDSDYWDKKLDEWQKKEVKKTGDCILVAMLAAINIPWADLKIWLDGRDKVRSQRIAKRDGISKDRALVYLRERDRFFREKIKRIYKIDFWDPKFYDLRIDTSDLTPEEITKDILNKLKN